jgi:hypothetical protein
MFLFSSVLPCLYFILLYENKSLIKLSLLGKTLLSKKAHEKSLTTIEQFNGRPKLPGWPGKDGAAPSLGGQWLL